MLILCSKYGKSNFFHESGHKARFWSMLWPVENGFLHFIFLFTTILLMRIKSYV